MKHSSLSALLTKEELLRSWIDEIDRLQYEHSLAARSYEKTHWRLGIPVVILTALVGASIFGTLQESQLIWLKVLTGFLSVTTVVLSSLQTFLGFGDRAAGHKSAADRLSELAKEAQESLACGLNDEELKAFLKKLRIRFTGILREAPTLARGTMVALINKRQDLNFIATEHP